VVPSAPTAKPSKHARVPTLSEFSVSATRVYQYGSPLRVTLEIDGGPRTLPASLALYTRGGALMQRVALGSLTTGAAHTVSIATAALPAGLVDLRVRAAHLKRGPHASAATEVSVFAHHMPLLGTWTYPSGGQFGAPRVGHTHQGQDLATAEGTPIVAPRGGVVERTGYDVNGGYYVVLRGAGENLSYVFMHLEAGSTLVHAGQTVASGQRVGLVGMTGDATGPHLHLEVWIGPWQAGGHPVDPLPYLKRWASGG
jgi:murein DD-endopeptidase MepM/ murein hydrolase activator NlpD